MAKFTRLNTGTQGLSINGVIREYEVNAGSNVNAGDFVEFVNKFGKGEFSPATSTYISACQLDNNRVFIAFLLERTATGVIIKINGTEIALGTSYYFKTNVDYGVSAVALNNNKVFVVYGYNYSGSLGGVLLTIEDMTITLSHDNAEINQWHGRYPSAVALSDSEALVSFVDSYNDKLHTSWFEIGETTIRLKARFTHESNMPCKDISLTRLTDYRVVLTYRREKSSDKAAYAIPMVKSDNGWIIGSKHMVDGGDVSLITSAAISEASVMLGVINSYSSYLTVCSVNGSSIIDSSGNHGVGLATYIYIAKLEENKALAIYSDSSGSYTSVLTTNETTINFGTLTKFDSAIMKYASICALSSSSILVAYNGDGISKYVTLLVDDDNNIMVQDENETTGTFVQPATSNLYNVGVAKTSGSAGERVEVYCVQS